MKKIYAIVATLVLSAGVNAQTNLSYESPITHPYTGNGLPEIATTSGWGLGMYSATTPASNGAQAVVLTTSTNQNFVDLLGMPSATVSGEVLQSVGLNATHNAAAITGSVDFQYAPVAGDSAVIIFQVYDTLAAGFSDDVLLYSGTLLIPAAVSSWTTAPLTLQSSGASGTPNELYFGGQSSRRSVNQGSALKLDNWVINMPTNSVGISEVINSSFKAYPNPATDVLNFTSDVEITSINIFSLDGKLVTSVNASSINVSELLSGVYMYEVTNADGAKAINKFVKK